MTLIFCVYRLHLCIRVHVLVVYIDKCIPLQCLRLTMVQEQQKSSFLKFLNLSLESFLSFPKICLLSSKLIHPVRLVYCFELLSSGGLRLRGVFGTHDDGPR